MRAFYKRLLPLQLLERLSRKQEEVGEVTGKLAGSANPQVLASRGSVREREREFWSFLTEF